MRYTKILKDRDGLPTGCAIVEFMTVLGVKNAIETLTDTEFKGRKINVQKSHGKSKQRGSNKNAGKENATSQRYNLNSNRSSGKKASDSIKDDRASNKEHTTNLRTVDTIELVGGLDIDEANDLRKACLSADSMLKVVLHRPKAIPKAL